jgi:predicted enzyme related to lactoylglutathione lyase
MQESDVKRIDPAACGNQSSTSGNRGAAEETSMQNLIVWADIPVTDLDRAMEFYGAVLQRGFMKMEGMDGVALPGPDEGEEGGGDGEDVPVAFDLVAGERMTPSQDGCTIYLEADGDAQGMLQRAADAGGEILMPASFMGDLVGTIGFFRDTEGNRIGVHQQGQAS